MLGNTFQISDKKKNRKRKQDYLGEVLRLSFVEKVD